MPEYDWRPKLTAIKSPIADDYWRYTTPEGKRRTSRLTVGRPVHFPQERCWYAPVMIEGYLTKITPIFGEGPVDALMNAMTFIKRFNEEMSEVMSLAKSRKAGTKTARQKKRGKVTSNKVQQKRPRSSSLANRKSP